MIHYVLFCLIVVGTAAFVGFAVGSYVSMRRAGRYLDEENFGRWRDQAVGRLWKAFGCLVLTAIISLLYFNLRPAMGLPFLWRR